MNNDEELVSTTMGQKKRTVCLFLSLFVVSIAGLLTFVVLAAAIVILLLLIIICIFSLHSRVDMMIEHNNDQTHGD